MRLSVADMTSIDTALARIEPAFADGEDGVAYHRAIPAATGNPCLLKTLTFLNHYMEACTVVTRRNEALLGDFSCQVCVDVAIAAAIRARDPMSARNAA